MNFVLNDKDKWVRSKLCDPVKTFSSTYDKQIHQLNSKDVTPEEWLAEFEKIWERTLKKVEQIGWKYESNIP